MYLHYTAGDMFRREKSAASDWPPGLRGGGSGGHTEIVRVIDAVDMSAGGIWIAYITKALGASQLVVAAPVTGSLVSISLFSPRDITETVGLLGSGQRVTLTGSYNLNFRFGHKCLPNIAAWTLFLRC